MERYLRVTGLQEMHDFEEAISKKNKKKTKNHFEAKG